MLPFPLAPPPPRLVPALRPLLTSIAPRLERPHSPLPPASNEVELLQLNSRVLGIRQEVRETLHRMSLMNENLRGLMVQEVHITHREFGEYRSVAAQEVPGARAIPDVPRFNIAAEWDALPTAPPPSEYFPTATEGTHVEEGPHYFPPERPYHSPIPWSREHGVWERSNREDPNREYPDRDEFMS